jgi:hypothetical protein
MPEITDPMVSIGYLLAAGAITVLGLGGYTLMLRQWLNEAHARNARLHGSRPPQ